jgi:hypothetical protein
MSPSLDGALVFFTDWMNQRTDLLVRVSIEGLVVDGNGVISSMDDSILFITGPAAFSISIPLKDCAANPCDPETGCGIEALDDGILDLGFKFGWELVLLSGARILLSEMDPNLPT